MPLLVHFWPARFLPCDKRLPEAQLWNVISSISSISSIRIIIMIVVNIYIYIYVFVYVYIYIYIYAHQKSQKM